MMSKLGLGTFVIDRLLEQISSGVIQNAFSQSPSFTGAINGNTNVNLGYSYNYVGIYFAGGPPRWMFDLPIDPIANAVNYDDRLGSHFYNPMVLTGWEEVNANEIISKYELTNGLPPLWETGKI